jgi:hypothetical protein
MKTLPVLLALPFAVLAFAPPSVVVPGTTFQVDPADVRGDSAALKVRIVVPEGWHIQSNAPLDDFLIPTEVKAAAQGFTFGKPVFPKPLLKELEALGGEVALFEDTVDVKVPVFRKGAGRNPEATAAALRKADVKVRYQACNDTQCLAPREIPARYVR